MKIWEVFPLLVKIIKGAHDEYGMEPTGHNFDHALQVAQIAACIAESEEVARLAGVAGICHNADRMMQKFIGTQKDDRVALETMELLNEWLAKGESLSGEDAWRIKNAVLLHSGPNRNDGDEVLVALQDADRVVCSMATTVMTATQFWSELPAIDPQWLDGDPDAHSYRNPKSVLKNLECRFDWIDPQSPFCVRLPKAWQLMERRVRFIKNYIAEVREQREEVGLWPDYPFVQ